MKNNLLKPFIKLIKSQDMSVFPVVYDEFKNLILFYGRKLKYEDAASELTLFLIELLYDIDLEKFEDDESDFLKRYIAVSIKNKYIALSVAKSKIRDYESAFLEKCCGCEQEFDDRVYCSEIIKNLSDMQRTVIVYHFVYGYSIAEIAKRLNITRQSVNKTKNRALKALRREFEVDEEFFI